MILNKYISFEKNLIMNSKFLKIIHTILAIGLGLFFINAGYNKLSSNKLKDVDEKQMIYEVIQEQTYKAPIGYNITMNTFKTSGYLGLVSIFQIIAGLLMIIPQTRLCGLLLLLPIIFNIFMMHVYFDNRMHENVETGILLAINTLLCVYYYKDILNIIYKPIVKS